LLDRISLVMKLHKRELHMVKEFCIILFYKILKPYQHSITLYISFSHNKLLKIK